MSTIIMSTVAAVNQRQSLIQQSTGNRNSLENLQPVALNNQLQPQGLVLAGGQIFQPVVVENKESWESALKQGKFVNLDLVLISVNAKEAEYNEKRKKNEVSKIDSYISWSIAWSQVILEAIVAVPEKVLDLVAYQGLIADFAKDYHWDQVKNYDFLLRKRREKNGGAFATIDMKIWSNCFNVNLLSSENSNSRSNVSNAPSSRKICFAYNNHGRCRNPDCEMWHACQICHKRHPSSSCWNNPNNFNRSNHWNNANRSQSSDKSRSFNKKKSDNTSEEKERQ